MRCPFSQGGERHGFVQNSSVSNLSRFRHDGGTPILLDFTGEAHGFGQSASSGFVSELRRGGGDPMLVDFTNVVFQSFEDTSSDDANKTPSTTVDRKGRGIGDGDTVREPPVFHRDG